MATGKATLGRRKERVNLDERSAIPGGFVFQLADEFPPANIMDGLGQAVILDHVLDTQALDANRLVLTNDASRELVLVIATAVGNACMDAGNFAPRLLPIARALVLLAQPPLGAGQLLLIPCEELGIADGLPIGGHDHRLEAQIQPNDFVGGRKRCHLLLKTKGDEIAPRCIFRDDDGRGRDSLWQGTRPADIQRVFHLGQPQDLPIPGEGTPSILSRLSVSACLEGGIASPALKEVGEGVRQMAQALLEWHAGDFTQKGRLRLLFEDGQPLGQRIGRETTFRLVVGVDTQAQRPIVDVAHTAEGAGQNLLLGSRWIKPILIRTCVDHVLVAFLGLDVALDGFEGHAPNRAAIVGVGPQRGQFLFEVGKLLPQLVSRCSLEGFHQAVDAELWITAHQQMHMVGQHFQLDQLLSPSFNDLGQQLLQPHIDATREDFPPILGAKHDVVMAIVDNISVALNYCLHAQSIPQNSSYVNRNYWLGVPTPCPKRNGPHIPTPGRAGVLRAGLINKIGRHAYEAQVALLLPDNFMTGGKGNEMSEAFQSNRGTVVDIFCDGIMQRKESSHLSCSIRG
jgi:hypothetical protein